jgi:hypothetical protein
MTETEKRCSHCGGRFGLICYHHWGYYGPVFIASLSISNSSRRRPEKISIASRSTEARTGALRHWRIEPAVDISEHVSFSASVQTAAPEGRRTLSCLGADAGPPERTDGGGGKMARKHALSVHAAKSYLRG